MKELIKRIEELEQEVGLKIEEKEINFKLEKDIAVIEKIQELTKRIGILEAQKTINQANLVQFNDFEEKIKALETKLDKAIKKDLKTARECLNFKGIYCDNKNCLNEYCPLNQLLKPAKDEQISNSKFSLKGKLICVIDKDDPEAKTFHAYEKEDVNKAHKDIINRIDELIEINNSLMLNPVYPTQCITDNLAFEKALEIINEVFGDLKDEKD